MIDIHILSLPRRQSTLRQAVDSVLAQGITPRVIQCHPGTSIGAARADAIASSNSDYVAWVDDDDALLPGAIDACMATISAHPMAPFVFTDEIIVTDGYAQPGPSTGTGAWSRQKQLCITHYGRSLCVIRRSAVLPWLDEVAAMPTLSEYLLRGLMAASSDEPPVHIDCVGHQHNQNADGAHTRTSIDLIERAAKRLLSAGLMRRR